MTQIVPPGPAWRGSLPDLVHIVNSIRRSRAFGRLTLRSTTPNLGLIHLYFHGGRLVHAISNSGDASATLADLWKWTRAIVRFERGISTNTQNVSIEHERMFDNLLLQMQRRYTVPVPENPYLVPVAERMRVIDSHIVAASAVEQLITPLEWSVLVESIRRVSLAVAHLVGPLEAVSVLRDIIEDFSSAFPALSCLQIAPGGYLHVVRTSQLDRIPRTEVIKGFAALITTCRYFCSPIIGEENARKLMIQALNGIGPALVSLGIRDV